MKLIDKDALVAEIERLREEKGTFYASDVLWNLEDYIDTLEVKEVNVDFEQELYKAFGQIKDFTLGVAIAKRFYDMGRKHNEPVSEELEEAASSFARKDSEGINNPADFYYTVADKARIFNAGANWQMSQMIKDATEVTVHLDAGSYPYIPQMELYDYDKDIPLAKEGDKYKVVLIKED